MKRFFQKRIAAAFDFAMCAAMNGAQLRRRVSREMREQLLRYIEQCETLALNEYYPLLDMAPPVENGRTITWRSPVETSWPENNVVRADVFISARAWQAPTVLMLHALMSANDRGYQRIAARFNALGWNAAFVHLPYHYSRRPRGFLNGELAITADLVRTAEGVRQSVMELRQLMRCLRARGCREFGVWATSYGGWIGALLSCLESDFRFVTLMSPIVNLEHAIWHCRAAAKLRSQLGLLGIDPSLIHRHAHLSSPLVNAPLCPPERVLLVGGLYDQIVRMEDVLALRAKWKGADFLPVEQGHFGYRMAEAAFLRLTQHFLPDNHA